MLDETYDVVVVGAGPSGSTAARVAAESCSRVLLLEKKRAVGIPVSCAEGISKPTLNSILEPRASWIATEVKGAIVTTPSGRSFRIEHPDAGYILERKLFDRDLACVAVSAGASIHTDVEVTGLLREEERICGVETLFRGKRGRIGAGVVIGADGVNSRVARWGGVSGALTPSQFHACAEYLLGNIEVTKGYTEFIAGNVIAPGGYAWVFPKKDDTANVGLGISPHIAERKPFEYLDDLVRRRYPDASRLETMSGIVPTSPQDRLVCDGLMLVGDAARVADPITGGGIANGLLSAMRAGKIAAECASKGDTSRKALSKYEREWNREYGRELKYRAMAREIYLKLTDQDFERIFDFVSQYFEGKVIAEFKPRQLIVPLIKSSARFLSLARHLI
jgi:digeranylgeranylglycerophospholipid reductase